MTRDKFIARLMIPIRDKDGKVRGFTGRVFPFDKSERPKYLNSPESEWFKKGEIWYGLDLSREQIRDAREVIVVEGNMDVISLHRFGLTNCVASQGTSVGINQVRQLKFIADRILLAFDNDNAGYISGTKLFVMAFNLGLEVRKVIIPKEFKDIDEYLSAVYKPGDRIELQTRPYLDFLIDHHHYQLLSDDPLIQRGSVSEICQILAQIESVSAELYLKKISDLIGIRLSALQATLDNLKAKQSKFSTSGQYLEDNPVDQRSVKETNQPQPASPSSLALANFQKLCCLYLQNGLSERLIDKLKPCFTILRFLVVNLQEEESLESYLQKNQDQLLLIQDELDFERTPMGQNNLWRSLLTFVDSNERVLNMNPQIQKDFEQIHG